MPSQVLFQAGSSEAWDQPVYLYLFTSAFRYILYLCLICLNFHQMNLGRKKWQYPSWNDGRHRHYTPV